MKITNSIVVQVYSKTASSDFSEDTSVTADVILAVSGRSYRLATQQYSTDITSLRVDLNTEPSSFYLEEFTIQRSDGTAIYAWSGRGEIMASHIQDAVINYSELGADVELTSNDSFLLFNLENHAKERQLFVTLKVRLSSNNKVESVAGDLSDIVQESRTLKKSVGLLLTEQEDTNKTLTYIVSQQERYKSEVESVLNTLSKNIEMLVSDVSRSSSVIEDSIAQSINAQKENVIDQLEDVSEKQSMVVAQKLEEIALKLSAGMNVLKQSISAQESRFAEQLDSASAQSAENTLRVYHELAIRLSAGVEVFKQIAVASQNALEKQANNGLAGVQQNIQNVSSAHIYELRKVGQQFDSLKSFLSLRDTRIDLIYDELLQNFAHVNKGRSFPVKTAARVLASKYRMGNNEIFNRKTRNMNESDLLISDLRNELLETRAFVETILSSRSWFLTKPLRFITRVIQRLRSKK